MQKEQNSRKRLRSSRSLRHLISIWITFFLSVCCLVILFFIQFRTGFLSNRNFRESLRESEYNKGAFQQLEGSLTELFRNHAIALEPDKIIDENRAYLLLTNWTDSVLAGGRPDVQKEIDGLLDQGLAAYLPDTAEEESVQQSMVSVENEAAALLERYVFPDFVEEFHEYRNQAGEAMWKGMLSFGGAAVLLMVVLLMMYRHKYKAFRYMMAGVFSALLCNLLLLFLFMRLQIGSRMVTGPDYYQNFLQDFIRLALNQCGIVVFIAMCAGILGILGIKILRQRRDSYRGD